MAELHGLVDEWLRLDKNPTTREEIERLWESREFAQLEKRLRNRIEFGTAGLRGRMEAGFARMNDLIVIQASQGLCSYVLENVHNAAERGVVVGHDHRHNSERFAKLTAAAFINRGVRVYLHRGVVHTPLVPFSVSKLNAACGVMVTASHNPKNDNGYKVYWENAVQIIAPHDEGIAASIKANLEPQTWDTESVTTSRLCLDKTQEMRDAYFEELRKLSRTLNTNPSCTVKFVHTAMHGVGHTFAVQAFETVGFPAFTSVALQRDPDPEFPTVTFPNPEEKGMDLAIREADTMGALYVLAQDPDADRFAAAEKQPDGTWRIFSGDQLGALLAAWTMEAYKATGKPLDKLAMVASTVSSKMIESMARTEGFRFAESLTGFKYIGNTALALVKEGYEVPFGYEEAIGFMIGSQLRDKDGISTMVSFAELVASQRAKGTSLVSYLDELYNRYGYFQTSNSYFVCEDPTITDRIFSRLRAYETPATDASQPVYPSSIAGLLVTQVRDLTVGYDSANAPSFKPDLPLSAGHMITFRASDTNSENSIVLTIRTSGTEPKIKYYLEGSGKDRAQVKQVLAAVVGSLRDEWMQAGLNGLREP
ncbi:hypothetical protein BOTBODRAFT_51664 [Botryobasidium botryosum FD-172 SS1]|uniref:Phosphoglucomutase n=1 Tax=Botryobasidium botryosum (strain FD-172 SS1) TaxID=930990 RepID=A0A067N0B0_BOTB1|nr:hypothetical protein BOTBODRAFT_51664 [Botryobasidium botryosum FD-172 SS1]